MLHNPNIILMLQFILALILCQAFILIIVKILQDNDLEDEMLSFDKQFTAILAFIGLIKKTESPRKRNLYIFILLLLFVLTIYLLFIGIKGGSELFKGQTFD
jgi:multisubunit Na+/H+ antiporter MnhF subunit